MFYPSHYLPIKTSSSPITKETESVQLKLYEQSMGPPPQSDHPLCPHSGRTSAPNLGLSNTDRRLRYPYLLEPPSLLNLGDCKPLGNLLPGYYFLLTVLSRLLLPSPHQSPSRTPRTPDSELKPKPSTPVVTDTGLVQFVLFHLFCLTSPISFPSFPLPLHLSAH